MTALNDRQHADCSEPCDPKTVYDHGSLYGWEHYCSAPEHTWILWGWLVGCHLLHEHINEGAVVLIPHQGRQRQMKDIT